MPILQARRLKFMYNETTHAVCVFNFKGGQVPKRGVELSLPQELRDEYDGPDGPVYGYDNHHLIAAIERVGSHNHLGLLCVLVPRDEVTSVKKNQRGGEHVNVKCRHLGVWYGSTMDLTSHLQIAYKLPPEEHAIKLGWEASGLCKRRSITTWIVWINFLTHETLSSDDQASQQFSKIASSMQCPCDKCGQVRAL